MSTFRLFIKVGLVLLILIISVVLAMELPGTHSGIVNIVEPLKYNSMNITELPGTEKPAVLPEGTGAAGAGDFGHGNGPPPHVPAEAGGAYDRAQSGVEGPPGWVPEEAQKGYEHAHSGHGGPPEWVPDEAKRGYEWSQSGKDSPPPWAGKGKPE